MGAAAVVALLVEGVMGSASLAAVVVVGGSVGTPGVAEGNPFFQPNGAFVESCLQREASCPVSSRLPGLPSSFLPSSHPTGCSSLRAFVHAAPLPGTRFP